MRIESLSPGISRPRGSHLQTVFKHASTSPVVPDILPANEQVNLGYGYQWWVPDQENGRATVFAGNGYGGQFVLVAPDYDIVVVFNAWDIDAPRTTFRLLQDRILPATRR